MPATIRIAHPEWLELDDQGRHIFGYNQEWYTTEWQRLAGCGPTTATQIINYISFRDGLLDPAEFHTVKAVLETMDIVWPYVQPRRGGGLFKTRWQFEGLQKWVKEKKWPYKVYMQRVMPFSCMRPSLEEIRNFMEITLEADAPIAFLNRHNGGEKGLQTWHWTPIVGMEDIGDDIIGTVYDDELVKEFSMGRWLKSTVFGGGLVCIR